MEIIFEKMQFCADRYSCEYKRKAADSEREASR